jgi:hypothetical protein
VSNWFGAALSRVPDYRRFLTVDEMVARARAKAEQHPRLVSIETAGRSTDGEPITMVRIGDGPRRMLAYALPHPNEPIGAMLIQFLLDELVTNDELRAGRSWYLLPCLDPDGTRLNEGWFAGPFTIRTYSRHFYRPRAQEQVEWTFPIRHKTFCFDAPISETRALMRALETTRPHFVYSLHNAGFGGAYYYLTHDAPGAYEALHAIPKQRGLFLSLGEPEMPWASAFHPAIYRAPTLVDMYDYLERYGDGDPSDTIQGGASSFDYLRTLGLHDTVALITELPYFQAPQIEDLTPIDGTRRDVILTGLERTAEVVDVMDRTLRHIEPHMSLDTRFHRAVASFVESMRKGDASTERWAKSADGMNVPATVAQRADTHHVGLFYRSLIASMLTRAIDAQLAAGWNAVLLHERDALSGHLERWFEEIERHLDISTLPIKSLVEVQYGALLAVLDGAPGPSALERPPA